MNGIAHRCRSSGTIATQTSSVGAYRPFQAAREFAHKLGIKKQTDWFKYAKGELPGFDPKPDDIPAAPHLAYERKGWTTFGDWLGTGSVATRNRQFQPFKKARAFVRLLGLRNQKEWQAYCCGRIKGLPRKPDDIPSAPSDVHRDDGWSGLRDWLGI